MSASQVPRHSLRFACPVLLSTALVLSASACIAATVVDTPWGPVAEPALPESACATLTAALTPVRGSIDEADSDPMRSQPDTRRIQNAIDACSPGQAVKLVKGSGGASAFLSGPLRLRSGVKLWIDDGVTLFASRNPADFDNGPGTCGTAITADQRSCYPFISADDTNDAGVVGGGTIDGRGGSLLTGGANAGRRSWWDVAFQNKTEGLHQQTPHLLSVRNGSRFTLYRVTFLNSPQFHVLTQNVSGLTAWNIKILSPSAVYTRPGYACPAGSTPDKTTPATCFTPETVKNTDGFDPGVSSEVLLAYSYISTGDDHVAVKSHGKRPSTRLAFLHNHFYYGHGMSIGSETGSGLSTMVVDDLSVDGFDSTGGIGLRIKSDSSRGGPVDNVSYSRVCMRNVRQPLVFDSYYRKPEEGERVPRFTNIRISGLHSYGGAKYGGGALTFAGFDANGQFSPLSIALDNVVMEGPLNFPVLKNSPAGLQPAATRFQFGAGTADIAAAIRAAAGAGVSFESVPGASSPVDCRGAFVPLRSVLPESPI